MSTPLVGQGTRKSVFFCIMSAPLLKYSIGNSASTSGAADITNSDTTVTPSSTTNFQAAPTPGEGMVLLDEGLTSEELAYSTGLSGGAFTTPLANRGLEGTAKSAHTGSFTLKGPLTAGMWNDLITSLKNILVQSTGAVDTTKVVDLTTAQTLTNKVMAYGSNTFTGFPGAADGWTSDSGHTWVYASASTFTITGVDLTGTLTKGTRLRFKQGGAYKYAVVVASAFSTDTTVTIAVNTDYTIANASIDNNYYSYQLSPQGFPDWFAYTTSWAGFSVNPTGQWYCRFQGSTCFLKYKDATAGTSSLTTLTFTAPVTPVNVSFLLAICSVKDNGTNQSTPSQITQSSGATLQVNKVIGTSGGFTGSGTKDIFVGVFAFEY